MITKSHKKFGPGQHKTTAFVWIFLCSAFLLLIFTPLFQKGTFIDGMLYKAVAFNFSEGTGFWQMKFTDNSMPIFCEQPPLYFSALGSFYKLFGSHYLVDRLFTFCLFIAFMVISYRIIKNLFAQSQLFLLFFIFFTLSVPVICWSYVNQVIEPFVCLLTSLSVLSFIQFIKSNRLVYSLYFGLFLLLLFLSKGFQSCFVIGLPLIYSLLRSYERISARYFLIAGSFFLAILVSVLKFYAPAKKWFDCYYQTRLVLTMQNVGNTTDSHIEIIVRFFTELIVPILSLVALLIWLKLKKKHPLKFVWKNFYTNKLALALLITSFLGSFPYAISLVQRGFYLLPSFVCFIFAILFGFRRYWLLAAIRLHTFFNLKPVKIAILLLTCSALIFTISNINTPKRDETLLSDLKLIEPYIQNEKQIGIEPYLWNYFSLHAYLYMAHHSNLSIGEKKSRYFLIQKGVNPDLSHHTITKINLPTRELDLYLLH